MFTAQQYAALKSELQTDPQALGYAARIASKDYVGVATLLATTNSAWTCTQPQIPLTRLLQWFGTGPAQKVYDYAQNAANNAALRCICLAAQLVFNGAMPYFDLSDPNNTALLGNLVSGGVLSSSDQANLLALQTISGCTRTQAVLNLPGAVASDADVRIALGV